jgi:phosphatidylserine/phosphatidylglycerophosphate/cardiolipin synthase-like enzyme
MGIDIYEFKPFPASIGKFVPRYRELVALPNETIDRYIRELDIVPIMKKGPRLCIHAKSFTVDGKIAKIGSHNFDPRSATFNSECGVIVWDEKFASLVEDSILLDIAPQNSWIVGKKNEEEGLLSKMSGMIGAISSALPVLDIWPYKYTSNFELRENMTPLSSPRHPDFHTHYKDVGQFPMVDSTIRANQTRLIKAFGGWARPFM